MARYVGTVTSPKPIEDVFDYMADFSNAKEWDPSSVDSRPLDDGAREGARYAVTSKFMGREVSLTYRITGFDRPEKVVLIGENEGTESVDTISFRKLPDGGTEVTYDADLRLKGARKVLEPVVGLAFRRLCERARTQMGKVLA